MIKKYLFQFILVSSGLFLMMGVGLTCFASDAVTNTLQSSYQIASDTIDTLLGGDHNQSDCRCQNVSSTNGNFVNITSTNANFANLTVSSSVNFLTPLGADDGGTGLSAFGDTNTILFTTSSNHMSWSSNLTYNNATMLTRLVHLQADGYQNNSVVLMSASTTMGATDSYYNVNVATNISPITVTLPTGADAGRTYWFNDVFGNAAVNNITIVPQGGATINGSSSYVINQNYGCVGLINNFTRWTVISYCPTNMLPGFSSYTTGSLFAVTGPNTLTQVTPAAAGNVLQSNGSTSVPGYGKVSVTSSIVGVTPYANGGTNASTAWTQGSVMYAGASAFSQDNLKFFYDATNHRLGVGTSIPSKTLDVWGDIQNVLQSNSTLTQKATLNLGSGADGDFGEDIKDNILYYASQNTSTLFTIDVTTSSAPTVIGSVVIAGSSLTDVKVQGDYAYLLDRASPAKFYVINIRNPKVPTLVGTLSLGTGVVPRRMKINGTIAYFTGQSSNKVYAVNISDPTNPTLLSAVTPTITSAYGLELEDGTLYVGGSGAVSIMDITTNPRVPVEVATTTLASSGVVIDLAASNHYLYTVPTTGSAAMTILDVRNPSAPVIMSTSTVVSTQSTVGIYITGRYLFISSSGNIYTYDISNPISPVKLITTGISTLSGGYLVGRGNNLYLTHNQSGPSTGYMAVFEMSQTELNALTAHSAQLGNTQVIGNLNVRDYINARQGLSVGTAGIQSQGIVSVSSTIIGGGAEILRHLSATSSLDYGATAAGTCDALTLTVTGASDGDTVDLGIPAALAGSDTYQNFWGYVSAANTVTVKRCNLLNTTTALSNPAAAIVRVDVWKH